MSKAAEEKISAAELARYRRLDCEFVLPLLADYVKADISFIPIRNSHTHRWHLRAEGKEFELLTTGPKWFDTRARRGGGGAIDLVMHLHCLDFKRAVARLRVTL